MNESLHTKYRPHDLTEVIGHREVLNSLLYTLERNTARAFMLIGPAGVGKTTIARIIASRLSVEWGLLEIDGATYNGIDDMRRIQETLQYKAFGKSGNKVIIIDEAHRLSSNAWDSLLKVVEEPPKHVTWIFCTTNSSKIPNTIRTRCACYTLNGLLDAELDKIIRKVIVAEKIALPTDVYNLIIREAHGSARQALVNLELCRDTTNKKEAARILETALETDATIELCRFIIKGGPWAKAATLIKQLSEENPEGVRLIIVSYISAALLNAKNDKDACFFLGLLSAFSTPYNTAEKWAPMLLSIGQALYKEE